jgi:hypothetical protein
MKRPFIALALLALPFLAQAQAAPKRAKPNTALLPATVNFAQRNAEAAKEVEALERQRFAAQVSKDYAFLEKAFADDLVYTHSGGKQNDKSEYLQSARLQRRHHGRGEWPNHHLPAQQARWLAQRGAPQVRDRAD